ncbi:PLDc N-terminal domain-containing protein, partial [Nocardia gipuzkoensis]
MSFWEIVWFMILTFLFIAYLMLLFSVVGDLFRDRNTSGWVKALWVVCLIVLPFLAVLLYLVVRGRAMAERSAVETLQRQEAQDAYIRRVARGDATS